MPCLLRRERLSCLLRACSLQTRQSRGSRRKRQLISPVFPACRILFLNCTQASRDLIGPTGGAKAQTKTPAGAGAMLFCAIRQDFSAITTREKISAGQNSQKRHRERTIPHSERMRKFICRFERGPKDQGESKSNYPPLVELRGIEPLTSSLRTTRSPS